MPEFKIRMPDGQVKTVSGPDRAGAMAFAKRNYNSSTPPPPAQAGGTGPNGGQAAINAVVQGGSRLRNIPNVAAAEALTTAADYEEERARRAASGDLPWWEKILTAQVNREDPEELRSRATELAVEAQKRETAVQENYPMTEAGGAQLSAISNSGSFTEGFKTALSDPLATASGVAQVGLQQVPTIAAALLTRSPAIGTAVFGASSYGQERYGQLLSEAQSAGYDLSTEEGAIAALNDTTFMERQAQRGVTRGSIISVIDMFTAGLASRSGFSPGSLVKNTGYQMAGGAGGEGAAEYADTGTINPGEMIIEGLAEGVTAPMDVAALSKRSWQNRYNKADAEYQSAASDLARLLRSISDAEGLNLKDVNTQGAAKQTLEAAHEQISGQIKAIVGAPGVRERLSPKNAETLDQLMTDYAAAQTAVRQGKNKVKSKVTDENAQAMARLLGPTQEAGQLLNLFAQGNVLTDLFADGTKGGVSQFTDFLNPLQNDGSGGFNVYRGINVLGGVAGATQFGIPATAGIVAGGRLLDAATGRRSKVNRFVKRNEKLKGQKAPEGPSLIAAAAQEAEIRKAQKDDDKNIVSILSAETNNAGLSTSPLGTVVMATGLDADALTTVVSELREKHSSSSELDKAANDVLDDIENSASGSQTRIRALTATAALINKHLNTDSAVRRVSLPDDPLQAREATRLGRGPQGPVVPSSPQVDTQAPSAPQAQTQAPAQPMVQTNGNLTTSQANYDAGKQANLDAVVQMQTSVLQAPNLPQAEQEALFDALEVAMQPATEPLVAMQEIEQTLLSRGVAQENVDTYFKPYVDRVLRQQGRKPSLLAQAQAAQEPVIKTSPLQQAQAAQGPSIEERRQAAFDKLEETEGKRPPLKDILKAATAQFSGKKPPPEESRVIPVPFNNAIMQGKFNVENPTPGGNYINLDTKQDITGTTYSGGSIKVVDGKPVLETSDTKSEPATKADGPKVKVNLFKQKAGWKWIDYDGPATIVSTTIRGKHVYSLGTDLQNPVSLETYPNEPSEPRLRPTTQGEVETGNIIGNISVRGKPHPVYDSITVASPAQQQQQSDESLSAPEMPSGPALNQVNNPLQVSNSDLDATNMSIMPSPKELSSMKSGTYKPIQKRTLVEFAQVLQDRWQKATGRTTAFEQTPENIDQISRLMATEAANALKSDNNAIGWYDRKLKAAKAVVSLVDPRVTQSPEAEAAFDYALAVTSNGQAVADNFEYAMTVFREFMDTGRMPTDTWIKGGERNKAMVDAFSFFNAYQDSGQNIPMHEFLDSDFTVSDLSKYIGQFNSKYDTSIKVPSSEGASEMVKGSYIVGPKIGQGFYQNIRGNYDPLTMDIWWMRMWNRLNGRAFEDLKDLGKNRATIRSDLKSADVFGKRLIKETMSDMGIKKPDLKDDTILDDFVSKLDKRYQAFFRKSKKQNPKAKPPKPQIFKSTGTMVKNLVLQLQAQPKNAGERSYMRQVTASALSKLKDIGIDISTADFQALMWYPEKQLFRKGGVAPGRGADNDYLDAAKMLATKEGISNEQIEEALPASERRGAVNNLPSPEGQDGGLYPGPNGPQVAADAQLQRPALTIPAIGPAGPRPISPQRRPFSKVTIPSVRQFFSKAKVPFEIGKPGSRDENGIQTIDRALELSTALGMTVNLFNNQSKMTAAAGIAPRSKGSYDLKGPRKGGKGSEGTIFGLNPGAHLSDGSTVSGIESLSTLLHEIGHGMTLGPMDLNSSQSNFVTFTNPVTGQQDYAPPGSFADSAIKPLLEGKGDPAILAEIDNLQQNIDTYTTNDPKQRVALRDVRSFMRTIAPWVAELDKKYDQAVQMGDTDYKSAIEAEYSAINEDGNAYMDYIKNVRELSVDPMVVYYMNPKLMKALAPKTAALIKSEFKKAGNKTIQFYSHPLPIVIATVMAMLAKGAEEKEEKEGSHQMPDGSMMKNSEMDGGGALSPQQAPPGLLTQQAA